MERRLEAMSEAAEAERAAAASSRRRSLTVQKDAAASALQLARLNEQLQRLRAEGAELRQAMQATQERADAQHARAQEALATMSKEKEEMSTALKDARVEVEQLVEIAALGATQVYTCTPHPVYPRASLLCPSGD